MARKSKQDAEQTRQAILDVALQLFSCQGVANTSLSEVARGAGVTRGAIYWHFANKKELLDDLWNQAILPYESLAEIGKRTDEPDPMGHLRKIIEKLLLDVSQQGRARQVFQLWILDRGKLGQLDRNESMQEQEQRRLAGLERFEAIFNNAINQGQLPAAFDVRLGALALLSFVDGVIMTSMGLSQHFHAITDVPRLASSFFHMLRSEKSAFIDTSHTAKNTSTHG